MKTKCRQLCTQTTSRLIYCIRKTRSVLYKQFCLLYFVCLYFVFFILSHDNMSDGNDENCTFLVEHAVSLTTYFTLQIILRKKYTSLMLCLSLRLRKLVLNTYLSLLSYILLSLCRLNSNTSLVLSLYSLQVIFKHFFSLVSLLFAGYL